MKYIKLLSALFLVLLFVSVQAQDHSQLAKVLSSGGGESTGGNYFNFGVAGETFTGKNAGGNYTGIIGFLCEANASNNIILHKNGIALRIFPNPVKNYINIDIKGVNTDFLFKVYDLQSKLLISGKHPNGKTGIDVSGLKQGLYIIKVEDTEGNNLLTGKMIKQ